MEGPPFFSSGISTTTASLVVMSELTLAASTSAVRTTWDGAGQGRARAVFSAHAAATPPPHAPQALRDPPYQEASTRLP